ncbi:hypothetical protein [Hydrocarboniclastica marina]|uniref:Uncharacterized protein n=1 Tax=Hydrocarboniclastica marina TaxID=2259620 RepID=A0A4P7XMD9_9ALTE|nr:hypothetical protein [Hydrocarboniclastica marina]QCF28113.1 hypothetical protein soil367_18755 [Hydrocarboniclastica marina]
MNSFDLLEIELVALDLDKLELDCNGISDLISIQLEEQGIQHQRMCGLATHNRTGKRVFPHCWILLTSGHVVDVRLRKWLGEGNDIPHGVFRPTRSSMLYQGAADPRERLSQEEIDELAGIGSEFEGIQI